LTPRYNGGVQYAIETDQLHKSFGDVRAVADVSLRVRPGEIYGFVGLNGAGKTTTIRVLLGMLRPTAGSVRILGQPVGPHGAGPWARVGHMSGSPSAYPQLTVRENLEITRRLRGLKDARAIHRVVELFALKPYMDRKAGTLSTGNLQRLGLARTLLHDPELLILDEPANGLDPAGVVEIRELLHSLARSQAVTIFMSSHILTEVDRLATRIGILHRGRLIEELDSASLEQLRAPRLEIRTRDNELAGRTLQAAGYSVKAVGGTLIIGERRAVDAPDEVAVLLVRAGAAPLRLAVEQEDLEGHFLRLTGASA
jgi:ABC-2 type transport system ATP-binding protein